MSLEGHALTVVFVCITQILRNLSCRLPGFTAIDISTVRKFIVHAETLCNDVCKVFKIIYLFS